MKPKRSSETIMFDMLKVIEDNGEKLKPTHLLYKSNLSHTRMIAYIKELKKKGLIAEQQILIITDKGFKFMANHRRETKL